MSFLNRTLNTVNWRRTSCDHTNNCFKVNCCIHHSSLPVPDVVSLQLRSTTPSFLPSVHGIKKWRENSKAASLQIHVRMYLLYVYGLLSLSLSIPEADFFSGSRSLPLSLSFISSSVERYSSVGKVVGRIELCMRRRSSCFRKRERTRETDSIFAARSTDSSAVKKENFLFSLKKTKKNSCKKSFEQLC